MEEYARFEIPFYWWVDPQQRSVEIYERGSRGEYVSRVRASSGVLDSVFGCPELRLDLDGMWAKVDVLQEG